MTVAKPRRTYYVRNHIGDEPIIPVAKGSPWEQLRDLSEFDESETVYIFDPEMSEWGEMWELKEYLGLPFNNDSYVEEHYMEGVEIKKKDSIFCRFKGIYAKDHDFIEVTEWTNGEGFDITISDRPIISLHDTELEVINVLIKKLRDEDKVGE